MCTKAHRPGGNRGGGGNDCDSGPNTRTVIPPAPKVTLAGPAALRPYHLAAELFPLMSGADFDALVADIKQNGLLEPIVTYNGTILDGRNRHRACRQLGIEPETIEFCSADPIAFVIARNLRRRHLSSAQKRVVIAKLLKLTPEKSNRQIAADVAVDHKTVQAVRIEAETTGEIPQLNRTVGADGKDRPARKRVAKPKGKPRRVVMDADFQAEAEAAARDLEIERDERIALSGGTELAAENDRMRKQIGMLDRRINALIEENRSLKYREKMWRERALAAGWKGRADG